MNARVFQEIMDSENLEMSKAVLIMLQEAKQCQKNIKSMIVYQHLPRIAEYIDRQKELKDKAIWQALEVAQLEKMYGFRLVEDRNNVIIATYQVLDPHSESKKKIRRHIEIMAELEKEYGICN
jgi:hypothetical protein